jgi:type IV secretion system protein VirB5
MRLNKTILALMIFVSQSSHADFLGVEDAQMIALAYKQLSELKAQYDELQSQTNSLKDIKNMNSGHYGFGNLSNGLDRLQSWQSPTSTWDDALHNLSGGNQSRYQSLVSAYEKNHPALSESSYARYTTPERATRFKEDKAVNRAVITQTTDAYNQINEHMKALHELSKQIEATPNTKGAIDLNSRLISEIGFIQLMSLRLQALMSQQIAQESLSGLEDRADIVRFNHFSK